jgi:hypothetical protein
MIFKDLSSRRLSLDRQRDTQEGMSGKGGKEVNECMGEETERLLLRNDYAPKWGGWMCTYSRKDHDEEGRDASRGALGF